VEKTSAAPKDVTAYPLEFLVPRSYASLLGRKILSFSRTIRGLVAFALITLAVTLTKFNHAARVIHPLLRAQIQRSGVGLLPIVGLLALALGFIVIGQTVALLTQFGAQNLTGVIMVAVIVREVGPMATALLVLAKIGTATVIELGTARALGEIEALEALGIDPVHYLVMPRVLGQALSIFALTVYLIVFALASGYLFAFLQDVPISPRVYVHQLAAALGWGDFLLLFLKTISFGAIIAVVTCYEGLARPIRLDGVATATTRAVVYSLGLCVFVDAVFMFYLLV